MKYIITLHLSLIFLSLSAQQLPIQQPVRFLALGDSYTIGQGVPAAQNWPSQLFDSLQARGFSTDTLRVIAQTGWRTNNLNSAMAAAQLDSNWTLVSLLIGVNNQFQGQNVTPYSPLFEELLQDAIGLAGGKPEHVLVLSIPDYAFTPFGQGANPNQITLDIDSFNVVNQQISQVYGVSYVDITPISRLGLQQPDWVASDRLHPSGKMYTEWVKLILERVEIATSLSDYSLGDQQAHLFYDPSNGHLHLSSPKPAQFRLWNLQGQLILSTSILDKQIIPFQAQKALYFYEFEDETGPLSRGKLMN